MSYNIPQAVLDMLQSGALPSGIKVVSNAPAGGAGGGGAEDGTWANPYRTIQAAVDTMVAPTGDPATWTDQIWIMSGRYEETVTFIRSKLMFIYTLGAVEITPPTLPDAIIWDKEPDSGPPAFLMFLPGNPVGVSEVPALNLQGGFQITGDSNDRFVLFRNCGITGDLYGEDPEGAGGWAGAFAFYAEQSAITGKVAFATGTIYEWSLEDSTVGEGIFCQTPQDGGGDPAGELFLDNAEIGFGSFTPFGGPPVSGSVWIPGGQAGFIKDGRCFGQVTADSIETLGGYRFDNNVIALMSAPANRESDLKDILITGNLTVVTANLTDVRMGGILTAFGTVDKIIRCEIPAATVFDGNIMMESQFGNLIVQGGGIIMKDCQCNNLDTDRFAWIDSTNILVTLDVHSPSVLPQGMITNSVVQGAITFDAGVAVSTYVDISTNSRTQLAGSAFPAGTNLLNTTTIP